MFLHPLRGRSFSDPRISGREGRRGMKGLSVVWGKKKRLLLSQLFCGFVFDAQARFPAYGTVLRRAGKKNKRGSSFKPSKGVGIGWPDGLEIWKQSVFFIPILPFQTTLLPQPCPLPFPSPPLLSHPLPYPSRVLGNGCASFCRRDGGFGIVRASQAGGP